MAGDYPITKIGEVAASISDTHKLGKEELVFLNTSDILHGKLLHRNYSAVKDWPGQAKKSIHKGDILFSEIRPANGRWAYVEYDADDFVVSTKLMVIRAKQHLLFPKFLYQFLTSSEITKWLQHIAESRSGTFPQITFDQVATLELLLPPLAVQKAIAAVLGMLDDKIELNQRMNATLEAMARSLFQSWFVDFDPVRAKLDGRKPAGLDAAVAALFPATFQDSPLGHIPNGWDVCKLSNNTEYLSRGIGPAYIEDGGICVLNQKCVREHRVDFSKSRRHNFAKKSADGRTLQPYDVLVNSTGKGTLGRVAQVFHLPEPTIVDSHVTIVRAGSGTDPFFLGANLTGREAEIEEMGEGSTGQTELSRKRLGDLKIITPPREIQQAFGTAVRPLLLRISENEKESRTLATLRDTLLPKLLSGELSLADRFVEDVT